MIWDKIFDILKPVEGIVDQVITNKEERGKIKIELQRVKNELASKALEVDKQLIEQRGQAVKAEIRGKSWLQRNWRPLLMLTIMGILVNNYILAPYINSIEILELPGGLWALLTTGTGGYVLGRSAEKITEKLNTKNT
jgi:hypothetical protein